MFKTFSLLFVSLFLVSCSFSPEPLIIPKENKKIFEEEDIYILRALHAEELQQNTKASEIFEMLYAKSDKKEYLYRSLENDLVAKESLKLLNRINAIVKIPLEDEKLTRLKVVALYDLDRLDEAENLSMRLAKKTQDSNDYLLVSDVLVKSQKYDFALKYLEGAYAKEFNEKILDKMSIILYVNLNRQKDAIAYLETHSRIHGTSQFIGTRLLGFYSDQNNIEGLLRTYKKLYAIDKDKTIAKKIIQIYTYKRDYLRLVDFLEESNVDDELLLQLYISSRSNTKAYLLADELYTKSGDSIFLSQSAIYEYESAKNKNSKKLLESVVRKLQKAVSINSSAINMNYLGYVLIDHEIDVKKGMMFVEKALVIEPESIYYLDSLAWGYYKLKNCKKAKSIMDKILKLEGGNNSEVMQHVNKINKCLKIQKGKK